MSSFEVIENIGDLEVALFNAGDRVEDMRDPLTRSAEFIQTQVMLNFASEGGLTEDGEWEPLKLGYERWKESRFGGEPILQLTHDLIDAAEASDAIRPLSETEVSYIIDDEKAPWHQSGRDRSKGGRLPARPIIPDDFYFEEPISEIVEDWLEDILDGTLIRVKGYSYVRGGRTVKVGGYTRRAPFR